MIDSLRWITASSVALLFASCASAPPPPERAEPLPEGEERVLAAVSRGLGRGDAAGSLLRMGQDERRVVFEHIDLLYPTRTVQAGGTPYPLIDSPLELGELPYEVDGVRYTLADFLADPSTIGLIAVKDGRVHFEHYAEGNDRDSRWISFSVTKSVTSMLIGAALADGFIGSVDEPVAYYLPRLRGTPYEDATIRDVLSMASGVAWNEDYSDPDADVSRAGAANGVELVRYLAALPEAHPPGEVFNYNTGETNLVGEILRSAIGNNAATYLTHKIWQPFGMESDATWLVSGPGEGETGGCCISATLRDYARIGLFALHDGVLDDGTGILPEGWMEESTRPSEGNPGYGYLWWLTGEGPYRAAGVFGQAIYIAPEHGIVIAAHSNAPTATGSDHRRHLGAVMNALASRLSTLPTPAPR